MQDRTCRFVTLGCKVNHYDTQRVREAMLEAGYREVAGSEVARVCVVNTCTVTHKADADCRYEIRRLLRHNPGAAIVLMGCYAVRAPEELKSLPGVVAVVDAPQRLSDVLKGQGVHRLPPGISRFAGRHRAFVKVQDGCMLDCSFCIIPQVRPSLESRPAEEIEAEVRRLVAAGYREIVLTGIHLGHYGLDRNRGGLAGDRCRLSHLVRRLARIPGDWRLRLSSLEATEVTDDLLEGMASEPRVCPHLHLCLQSGSDSVLAAMRRRYRVEGFLRRVERIRRSLDQPALTSDVIAGFPGESDADFERTMAVCSTVGFSKIHVFPFSPRAGTPAATMTGQVDRATIQERKSRLLVLESQLAAGYYQSLVGRKIQVLVEHVVEGPDQSATGTACRYVPVSFQAELDDEYKLVDLQVIQASGSSVTGRRLKSMRGAPVLELPITNLPHQTRGRDSE